MNKMCVFFLMGVVFGVSAGFQGCASNAVGATTTITETGKNADGSSTFDSYLVYGTDSLRRKVIISDVLARKSDDKTGGLTQTTVTLTNTTKKTLSLAYKFMWLDADGFEIMPDSFAWTPITLQGLEGKNVQSVSPRTTAVTFKVKVALQ